MRRKEPLFDYEPWTCADCHKKFEFFQGKACVGLLSVCGDCFQKFDRLDRSWPVVMSYSQKRKLKKRILLALGLIFIAALGAYGFR